MAEKIPLYYTLDPRPERAFADDWWCPKCRDWNAPDCGVCILCGYDPQ